ncbi:hypothetical protein FB45DRAFT_915498 [Roridomyces roridus]|uniref:Chitinase n=1 Tax=Roridomyces roridus TaxID=1738132 RepID=A0AAD7BTU5_9AGAR|nr:hypothetical protein FB45DRAFT_915498 [Roridomyces roridus]
MRHHLALASCAALWSAIPVFAQQCKLVTVVQNDTCFSIAQTAGITVAQLQGFNPNANCNNLVIGEQLCVTTGTAPSPPQQHSDGSCATYTTVPNDSCSAIAGEILHHRRQHRNLQRGILLNGLVRCYCSLSSKQYLFLVGCAGLQVNYTLCVSTGTPPPPPIIAGLQCGPQSAGNASCPLNACLQCGPNACIRNCGIPTLPSCSTTTLGRKIGYYAGWGDYRSCGVNVAPDQINWDGFTGAHYAFATISQDLKIQLADTDVPLLKTLVAQKSKWPKLQVIIAVGGWAFSEDDPTRDLFSVMIASSASRATFISSVASFMSANGVDGVDIDFEYPSAIERSVPATDTPNLTSFFQELRAGLPAKAIISCATPAGYWFLQGFEIDKIAKSVNYLNMMSYDYHGPWDTNVTDQAPVTNPQTSILDMQASAQLYVRAGIDLSIVNLGLAYYGRTYQLADASCVGYNCTMVGGGAPGPCTQTPGILTQFEIEDLLNTGAVATLDKASETYWFDHQGSLITFDQQDTWAAKNQFAEQSCFGGTFIWSLDESTSANPGDGGGNLGGSNSGGSGSGLYTTIQWNPNPFPSSGAASETFIQSAGVTTSTIISVIPTATITTTKTVVIPAFTSTSSIFTVVSGTFSTVTTTVVVPASTSNQVITKTSTGIVIPVPKTSTTTITLEGYPITIAPGGTPVPNAITPSFSHRSKQYLADSERNSDCVHRSSNRNPHMVFHDHNPAEEQLSSSCSHGPSGRQFAMWRVWHMEHPLRRHYQRLPPGDVGIIGGITPVVFPPPDWQGSWSNPFNLPTGNPGDPDDQTTQKSQSKSQSQSSTSQSACPTRAPPQGLPDDPENADWSDLGSDPDTRRRRAIQVPLVNLTESVASTNSTPLINNTTAPALSPVNVTTLVRRAGGRTAKIPDCNIELESPSAVNLGAGTYYLIPMDSGGFAGTQLIATQVGSKPRDANQSPSTNREIGYINQFFTATIVFWIENDVINYNRVGGGTLGAALLAAIDNTNNMVWVDKALNQAKSNVVNNNRQSAGDPPQSGSTVGIIDFETSAGEIYDVETFLRNFAALGSYFDQTSGVFRGTAASFQQLLSEVTPSVIPDNTRPLPTLFNAWLTGLINTYPTGCTSRATNAWNFYRNEMQSVAAATTNGVVPNCFPLYTANTNLIPAAPLLPACNVPGTEGTVGYVGGGQTVTQIPFDIVPQRIMGAGNLNFYAVGSGTSLTDAHYQAIDASIIGSQCTNVYSMLNDPPNSQGSLGSANIALQCGTSTGKQQVDFNWVFNGQALGCAALVTGHAGGTTTTIFCSANQGAALACAGQGAFTIQMRWFPS